MYKGYYFITKIKFVNNLYKILQKNEPAVTDSFFILFTPTSYTS